MTKPSPEEIAEELIQKLPLKLEGDFRQRMEERTLCKNLVTEALRAERQRTMPSREEFKNWMQTKGGVVAALDCYDWIESRMR